MGRKIVMANWSRRKVLPEKPIRISGVYVLRCRKCGKVRFCTSRNVHKEFKCYQTRSRNAYEFIGVWEGYDERFARELRREFQHLTKWESPWFKVDDEVQFLIQDTFKGTTIDTTD